MGFMTCIQHGTFDITSPKVFKLCGINHLDSPWWLILPTSLTPWTARCHTLPCIFGHILVTRAYNHFIKNTKVTILCVVKQIESKISRIILYCLHITSGGSPSMAPVLHSPPSPSGFSLGTSAPPLWHSR